MESRLSRRNPDPKNEAAWPGKGPIRAFDFMVGERKAFWAQRRNDQGAVVFVGDSLTGGWKNLAKDFPKLKVANRGLGGDTSRGALFRFREDALALNPKAVVIEIGNNDLTAMGSPADMLGKGKARDAARPVHDSIQRQPQGAGETRCPPSDQ
jgi:lysophospholipase L1-like esterase